MNAVIEMPCHFAALRLAERAAPDPVGLTGRIAGWLDEAAQTVEATGVLPDGALWLRTPDATIRLAADGQARLVLHVAERARTEATHAGEALLLHLVYRLSVRLAPEQIEWQTEESVVDAGDFVALAQRAAGGVRPTRPAARRDAHRCAPRPVARDARVDSALDLRLRQALNSDTAEADETPDSMPRRLAAWALSGAAALIWLPLAPVLLAINLRHGPDLRVSAQACSVLGLFTALDHVGAFGDVAAMLPV